jgi:ornithine cyclodeaminase/alanine dehydrogenase-like protein (mu-crystallin family)
MDFIVSDSWCQVKHHGVNVSWRAVRDGVISENKIRGDLGEIIVGKKLEEKIKKRKYCLIRLI